MNRLLQKFGILAFALLCSTVTFGQIYVNAAAGGANDGSSWADAYTNLQDALDAAAAGDQIWVAAGTYTNGAAGEDAFHVETGVTLLGGFAGTETSADERDPAANAVILSGDLAGDDQPGAWDMGRADNSRRVVLVDTLAEGTVFDGFTVSGGNALFVDSTSRLSFGAGLLSFQNIMINNCTFTDNRAGRGAGVTIAGINTTGFRLMNSTLEANSAISGGGAYLVGAAAGLVEGCDFISNTAEVANNGGGFGAGLIQISIIDTIRNCSFLGNENPTRVGGGIFSQDAFSLFEGCTFEANNSNDGGGLYIQEVNEEVVSVVNDCGFFSNIGGRLGGAICIGGGDVEVMNSTFENNEAPSGGGAFFIFQENFTIVSDCEFSGNISDFGGVMRSQGDESIWENCTFEDNEGPSAGGAICGTFESVVNIEGGLFFSNTSAFGGAVFVGFGDLPVVLNMSGVTFQENVSPVGGALQAQNLSEVTIEDCVFEANAGENLGGALNLSGDSLDLGFTNIRRSQFIGNFCFDGSSEGGQGGAINNIDNRLNIENSVFAFNQVGLDGIGGALSDNISSFVAPQAISLTNNTFYGNVGDIGSCFSQWSDPEQQSIIAQTTMQNNIFAISTGGTAYEIEDPMQATPDFTSNGGNIFYDASIMDFAVAEDQMNVADPGFVNPDLLEYDLKAGAVAINAGVNDGAPVDDINGNIRLDIGGDQVDAGAYERNIVSTDLQITNEFDVNIAPSVTSNIINVSFTDDQSGEVRVLVVDYQGRVVMDKMEEKGPSLFRQTYHVGELAQGAYILRVITENGSVSGGRFVVTK